MPFDGLPGSKALPHGEMRFMLSRVWVSVLLIGTLTGCASRSRAKPFLPNMNIPLECATSIRLVECDLSFSPSHCRTAAVAYRKGCEEVVVAK
jgi:hypothetical protein